MSKLSEIIKLIPRGIANIDKYVEGRINNIKLENNKLSDDEAEEILGRRLICSVCPFMSKNATTSQEYKALYGKHYTTRRSGEHCSLCGCGIDNKTASLSSNCGIEQYNCDNPERQMELKWTAYEKHCL